MSGQDAGNGNCPPQDVYCFLAHLLGPDLTEIILLGAVCLKPQQQKVLGLHFDGGVSYREIAQRMGWNEAMVKMRAYRARNKLRIIAKRRGLVEKLQWTN